MRNKLKQVKWVKWDPNNDVVVALLTLVWLTAAFCTMNRTVSLVFILLGFMLLTNLIVNVVLPTYWVVSYRKQPLSELGITTQYWLPSLILSLIIAVLRWPSLGPLIEGRDWVPHVLTALLTFWNPFFLHGWLQLRFERAFGVLPGILLGGLGLAIYHIGTSPYTHLVSMVVEGIAFAALFSLTRNLLVLWPLAWGINRAVGTATAGRFFDWRMVPMYVVLLVIQLGFIVYMDRRRARMDTTNW